MSTLAPKAPGGYETTAPYYDLFARAQDSSALPQMSFFADLVEPGQRVLDVGAGTGRIAVTVARAAEYVYCLEPSPAMRAALLARVLDHDLVGRVTVLSGSAPDFQIPARFDYVYLAGVMQYLEPTQRRTLFDRIASHLDPGGIVAMDMIGGESGSGWPLYELARTAAGHAEYRLLCSANPEGPLLLRSHLRYQTRLHDRLIADEHVERVRHFHPTGDAVADLKESGLEVTGGSALEPNATSQPPPDGGTLIARLGDPQRLTPHRGSTEQERP